MKTITTEQIRQKLLRKSGLRPDNDKKLIVKHFHDAAGTLILTVFALDGTPAKGHATARPVPRGSLLNIYGPDGRRWKAQESVRIQFENGPHIRLDQ